VRFRAVAALFLLHAVSSCKTDARPATIQRRPGEIEFTATVHASAFAHDFFMPAYHAVVGTGGRMRHAALLQADVADRDVLEALESVGAKPGDNLPMSAWDDRRDPRSRAPDLAVAGTPIEALLRLPGRQDPVPLARVLEDSGGRGLDLRFGGNAANIPRWRSGCIVCLYSCPGGKVGNARYTVRDYVNDAARFRVRDGILPPDGSRVGVVLRPTR